MNKTELKNKTIEIKNLANRLDTAENNVSEFTDESEGSKGKIRPNKNKNQR